MSNKEKVFKKCDELFGEFEWTIDIHRSLDDGEIIYYINDDKNIEVAVGSSFKSLLSNINGQEYSEEIANKFFVDQFLTVLVIAMISALYPLSYIRKLNPIKAMRK